MVVSWMNPDGTPLRVGDHVRFRFGLSNATGRIIGTRGPSNHPQAVRYLVEFRRGGSELLRVELGPAEFEAVKKPVD